MDDHMSSAWLSGKISDEEYKAYQDARFKHGAMAGKVLVNGVALATGGAAVVQAGKTLVQKGIKAGAKKFGEDAVKNAGVNAVNGVISSSAGAAVSGADIKTGLIATGVGTGVSVVTGGVFKPRKTKSFMGNMRYGIMVNTVATTTSSVLTTHLTNPSASKTDYGANIIKSNIITLPGNLFANSLRFGFGVNASKSTDFGFGVLNATMDTMTTGIVKGYEQYQTQKPIIQIVK